MVDFYRSVAEAGPRCVSIEPDGGEQVELEMLVSVSQVSVAQRDTVVRQLAALLHVVDGDIQVGALQGRSHLRYRRDDEMFERRFETPA